MRMDWKGETTWDLLVCVVSRKGCIFQVVMLTYTNAANVKEDHFGPGGPGPLPFEI